MFVEAAGGVLVCGAWRVLLRPSCGTGAGSRRCSSRSRWRAPRPISSAPAQALQATACGFAVAGAVAMVVGRLGRPLPLSWLDFVMGGCAVGALAVTTGAELPATLAAIGVAATLGLARWRVSVALAWRSPGWPRSASCRCWRSAGLVAASWLREPEAEPGPEFSPVVLAAILAYAGDGAHAARRRAVRQPAGARGGARDGHRPDRHGPGRADDRRPPARQPALRGHRRSDRARQPPAPARAPRGRDRRLRRRGRAAADRPRRLQGAQRHARPRRGRRGAAPDRAAAEGGAARGRLAVAARRRRVRGRGRPGRRGERERHRPAPARGARALVRASAASACTSTPASASRSSPSTRATRTGCSSAPTSRCTRPSARAPATRSTCPSATTTAAAGSSCSASCATGSPTASSILHYQPKAEIATGEVRGVEALVRWVHPRRGLLMPADFLPLADHSGLGRSLTAFVLDRALEEIGAHRARRLRPQRRGQPRSGRSARPRAPVGRRPRARHAAASRPRACGSRSPRTS